MSAISRLKPALDWFRQQRWKPFPYQQEAWQAYLDGESGLVNAPTGSGKTYSLFFGPALEYLAEKGLKTKQKIVLEAVPPAKRSKKAPGIGLRVLWITPVRALANEIQQSCERASIGLHLNWEIAIRTGDTLPKDRAKQKKNAPQMLVTTPESLHLMLATKGYAEWFKNLKVVVCDEWHELVGSKRGVLVELALSRLKVVLPELRIWGISATIGNLEEAAAMLLGHPLRVPSSAGNGHPQGAPQRGAPRPYRLIRSNLEKRYAIKTIFPDRIERFPWSGHLGINLVDKVLPIIHQSQSTLIFTNTRHQCEVWYQQLLEADPMLAGQLAMHHGSLSREIRDWVEDSLHSGRLKAVVCTSSLDLGVDFRPVQTVIQIGSPKGVARFMQRAGRAGHQPGAVSSIYFLPTHSLEIIEGAALRQAVAQQSLEARQPYRLCFDVLIQYMVTLAVSDGFRPEELLAEVRTAYSYAQLTDEDWQWCLDFISKGGKCLYAYDEYKKVEPQENGVWLVTNGFIAKKHRLGIGAIVSDAMLQIKFMGGKFLGSIEEGFITQLKRGDVFWYAGKSLEFVRIKDMMVQVRKSSATKGKVPTWAGGRMPMSSELATEIRELIALAAVGDVSQPEMEKVVPLLELQQRRSYLPAENELLIEYFSDQEGYHLLCYPFEGRAVHEGLSALLAYRIARITPITFSIAVNDYGFELLSDLPIPLDEALTESLFSIENLHTDIENSVNSVEMARRRFRDIASIAGLVFKGFPGKEKMGRHLQASSQLFFGVFTDYEPGNLLLLQAYREVMQFQLQEDRLLSALERINQGRIVLREPVKATPFSFPLIVTRLREKLSSEKLADRIQRMKMRLEKG